jgi:hypothetical protein
MTILQRKSFGSFIAGTDYAPASLIKVLTSDTAATDGTSTQDWFSTGAVALAASGLYQIDGLLHINSTTTTTSHTVSCNFSFDTLTKNWITWVAFGHPDTFDSGADSTNNTTATFTSENGGVCAIPSTVAGTSIEIEGFISVNAAGTIKPQFSFSAAPGNTPKVIAGSFIKFTPVLINPNGTWS